MSTFPVILTVVGAFTHHQAGLDAVLRLLRGISLSLIGFCAFFAVVGYALPHFDLAAYVATRLRLLRIARIELVCLCTFTNESQFYSFRRSQAHKQPDYGRQLSAIVLP